MFFITFGKSIYNNLTSIKQYLDYLNAIIIDEFFT